MGFYKLERWVPVERIFDVLLEKEEYFCDGDDVTKKRIIVSMHRGKESGYDINFSIPEAYTDYKTIHCETREEALKKFEKVKIDAITLLIAHCTAYSDDEFEMLSKPYM